jgi:ABC-2 type transport system permease protein
MIALLRKEINGFFNSLVGYSVIATFLVLTNLMLWVIPGSFNIPELEMASMEPFFFLAPWVMLLLIPAITMKSFAEETDSGTIELLFTRPLSDSQIIYAKFFGALILVIIALFPTLLTYYTIIAYGNPQGNIDHGATIGSYIGLILLASGYVAVGIFASCLTSSQIVAFVISIVMCFMLFFAFHALASFDLLGSFDDVILKAGIKFHYDHMSTGLIDTRDVIYFLTLIIIFLLLTKFRLGMRRR